MISLLQNFQKNRGLRVRPLWFTRIMTTRVTLIKLPCDMIQVTCLRQIDDVRLELSLHKT